MHEDPIVIGYDGSVGAEAALAWGLSEAALRGLSARVVTVVDTHHEAPVRGVHDLIRTPVAEAESALDKVLFAACTEVPGVEVTGRALVLGGRGQGGFAGRDHPAAGGQEREPAVWLAALFTHHPITTYTVLLLPLAVQEMVLAVWLIAKGFAISSGAHHV